MAEKSRKIDRLISLLEQRSAGEALCRGGCRGGCGGVRSAGLEPGTCRKDSHAGLEPGPPSEHSPTSTTPAPRRGPSRIGGGEFFRMPPLIQSLS